MDLLNRRNPFLICDNTKTLRRVSFSLSPKCWLVHARESLCANKLKYKYRLSNYHCLPLKQSRIILTGNSKMWLHVPKHSSSWLTTICLIGTHLTEQHFTSSTILLYKSPQDAHVTEFILSDNCSTCCGVTITHLQEHKTTVTIESGNRYTVLFSAAIVE
jgi:hypothetical protein